MGVKSFVITVNLWLSMLKRWTAAAPAFIRRRRYVRPDLKRYFDSVAFGLHFL